MASLNYGITLTFAKVVGIQNLGSFLVPSTSRLFLRSLSVPVCFEVAAPNTLHNASVYLDLPSPPSTAIGQVLDFTPGGGVGVTRNVGKPSANLTAPWEGCQELFQNEFLLFVVVTNAAALATFTIEVNMQFDVK